MLNLNCKKLNNCSDITFYLAAIKVLEHNHIELKRMLENESHNVRHISSQKEI